MSVPRFEELTIDGLPKIRFVGNKPYLEYLNQLGKTVLLPLTGIISTYDKEGLLQKAPIQDTNPKDFSDPGKLLWEEYWYQNNEPKPKLNPNRWIGTQQKKKHYFNEIETKHFTRPPIMYHQISGEGIHGNVIKLDNINPRDNSQAKVVISSVSAFPYCKLSFWALFSTLAANLRQVAGLQAGSSQAAAFIDLSGANFQCRIGDFYEHTTNVTVTAPTNYDSAYIYYIIEWYPDVVNFWWAASQGGPRTLLKSFKLGEYDNIPQVGMRVFFENVGTLADQIMRVGQIVVSAILPYNRKGTEYSTLLDEVGAVGAGSTFDLHGVFDKFTWEIVATGAPTTVSVTLEGSLDEGTTWYVLDTSTTTTSELRHVVDKPVRYIRANLGTFVETGVDTLTVRVLASRR